MLDNFLRLSMLFDFYGGLLTKKQQECLRMHLYQDLSLSEIASLMNVSRQAAYDTIHRCEAILENYEQKLKAMERDKLIKVSLQDIMDDVESLKADFQIKKISGTEEKIKKLLEY
ncbi:YlxM family DNA-binding protein [Pectinatus haikarae]